MDAFTAMKGKAIEANFIVERSGQVAASVHYDNGSCRKIRFSDEKHAQEFVMAEKPEVVNWLLGYAIVRER